MSGKIVIIKPDGTKEVKQWDKKGPPNWELLRDAVGGYIERVRVRWDGKVRDAYVNENGYACRLEQNDYAKELLAPPFVGTSCIVGNLAIWVPDPKR